VAPAGRWCPVWIISTSAADYQPVQAANYGRWWLQSNQQNAMWLVGQNQHLSQITKHDNDHVSM